MQELRHCLPLSMFCSPQEGGPNALEAYNGFLVDTQGIEAFTIMAALVLSLRGEVLEKYPLEKDLYDDGKGVGPSMPSPLTRGNSPRLLRIDEIDVERLLDGTVMCGQMGADLDGPPVGRP
jgi:hypothetical protein